MSEAGRGSGVEEAVAEEVAPGMRDEVWESLTGSPRTLSSKYFYDTRGSELFVEITHLPEYYPTRTERALLDTWAEELVTRHDPRALLELGAGSARKTRVILDALVERRDDATYLPQDVSGDFLEETARTLRRDYPTLDVAPLVGDLTRPLDPDLEVPRPVMVALLGSTLGNFADAQARDILANVRAFLGPEDRFLMGADLRPSAGKSREELEAAYNDARGVTAAFNRNILSVLNERLDTDFDPDRFQHRAFYDPREGRIEMHLVSLERQGVTVPERGRLVLEEGETIRTEISCKYDRPTVETLFRRAGMTLLEWRTDARGRYALAVGAPS